METRAQESLGSLGPSPRAATLCMTLGKSPCSLPAGQRLPQMQAGPARIHCVLPRVQSRP